MGYTVLLLERDFVGRPIDSPLAGEVFESLVRASAAAKSEAFFLSHLLGVPIAIAIADDQRTLIRHIVSAHVQQPPPRVGGPLLGPR